MIKKVILSLLFFSIGFSLFAQTIQKGPYTVRVITNGVYHIEDANDSNPAGEHYDVDGKFIDQNNCSDIYLIIGEEKALLIDLSNQITWDNTANESLRSIVYERIGNKKLHITFTHKHGDHTGMLPAFVNDTKVQFWLSKGEFEEMDIFPVERTTYFAENASFNLGGDFIINTMEVSGHTSHSTLFFLKDKNIVFTGDAIGSGGGLWLFNYESYPVFCKSFEGLMNYIKDPANNINIDELSIFGGHAWQLALIPNYVGYEWKSGDLKKLSAQFLYDMQMLIEKMETGSAETESVSYNIPFLDTKFKYGTASITWNKNAEEKYVDSVK